MSDVNLAQIDLSSLRIIHYPDPLLARAARSVERIDEHVRRLAERMFELMAQAKGVGLAAPQVGLSIQMFVGLPSGQPEDRRVYINPRILSTEGKQEEEEGCLSVPGVNCKIKRYKVVTIKATNLDSQEFQESGTDLAARMYQHETDHLNGVLILDRMGTVAKLANRRTIRELEEKLTSQ